MARKVFFSFHYKPDNWRVSQVRNMGVIEENPVISDNEWEEVTDGGDEAIKKWINNNLSGKSCTVVLIGSNTANRKWINYEIKKSWNNNKGLLGIYIHKLKNLNSEQSVKGSNPFDRFTVSSESMSGIVKAYNPPFETSKASYKYISENIADWVEEAISIRSKY